MNTRSATHGSRVVYRDNERAYFGSIKFALWLSLRATGSRCSITTTVCIQMALHFVAEAIAANPNASLIYSDEDKVDQSNDRYDPYFKCDYNYELLLAHNMICHLAVFRRSLIDEIGGFRSGFEGAQDYDLALRAIGTADSQSGRTSAACPVSLARAPRKHCVDGRCQAVCGRSRTPGRCRTLAAARRSSDTSWRHPRHPQ